MTNSKPPPLQAHDHTQAKSRIAKKNASKLAGQNTDNAESQLNTLVVKLQPVLKHINMHRFLWAFTGVCAFIAWNRGLMLLYALVAFLLAVLLVSYVYRFFNLRHIRIQRELPHLVTAGEAFQASYQVTVKGHKHFLEIIENYTRQHAAHTTDHAHQHPQRLTQPLFFTHIKHHATISIEKRFHQRGVYISDHVLLCCAYPLGLLHQQKKQAIRTHKLYVLPATFAMQQLDSSISNTSNMGQMTSQSQGVGEELTGLRQYQRGDPLKLVHWSATAKQMSQNQPWLSKQLDSQSKPSLLLVINQFQCRGQAFETMLSIVASLAQFASEHSYPCVILGVETHTHQNKKPTIGTWHISVPAQDKHLKHNLVKLAKIHPIYQPANTPFNPQTTPEKPTSKKPTLEKHSKPHTHDTVSSYQDLLAQGLAQFALANTIVTFSPFSPFSPFSVQLPTQALTHLAMCIKTGNSQPHTSTANALTLSKQKQDNCYHYQIDADAPLPQVATLFTSTFTNVLTNTFTSSPTENTSHTFQENTQ